MATFEHYDQGTPSWVELMTPDQRAAGEFYGQLFGWRRRRHAVDDEGDYYIIAKLDGDAVAGIAGQMPELAGHPAFWGVYLAVDDVDATTAKVEARRRQGRRRAVRRRWSSAGCRRSRTRPARGSGCGRPKTTIGTARANEPGTPTWNECVTPDVAAAAAFYAEVLGMGSEAHGHGRDGLHRPDQRRRPAGRRRMVPPCSPRAPPHWNVYFNVDGRRRQPSRAEELGGKVVAPAFDVPAVGRMAMVADPQGAMFWVMAGVRRRPAPEPSCQPARNGSAG